MPKFRVLRRVDAWIDYETEVDAESSIEAVEIAERVDGAPGWKRVGEAEFWNARFATLDEHGNELPETVLIRG